MLITPPIAILPYRLEDASSVISTRSTLTGGTRVQYTQPPNGSLKGTPSSSTSVRLWPLGPMPRSDTPCAVGCAARLLVRLNRLKLGTLRRTSSAVSAGEASMVSLVTTLTLAGTSPSRCSVRVGVTVTVSNSVAGSTTISSPLAEPDAFTVFSAKPPARTTIVTSPVSGVSIVNRPSGPGVARCSGPDPERTTTAAPDTMPQLGSCTTPDTDAANAKMTARTTLSSYLSNANATSDASSPPPVATTTN